MVRGKNQNTGRMTSPPGGSTAGVAQDGGTSASAVAALSQRRVLANQLYELGKFAEATASYRAILHSCWCNPDGTGAAVLVDGAEPLLLVVAANHAASVLQQIGTQTMISNVCPSRWLGSVLSACAWSTCALDHIEHDSSGTWDNSVAWTVCERVRKCLLNHPSVADLNLDPAALPKSREQQRKESRGLAEATQRPLSQTSSLQLVKLQYRRAKLFLLLHVALFSCGCHALLQRKQTDTESRRHDALVVLSSAELSWLSLMGASRDLTALLLRPSKSSNTATQEAVPTDALAAAQELRRELQQRLLGYDMLFSNSTSPQVHSRELHPHLTVLFRGDATTELNVQHGSGLAALHEVPAGSSIVVEHQPLLLVVEHDDGAEDGSTTAYERRFVAAIQTVMRRLAVLDRVSVEEATASVALVDLAVVRCAPQRCADATLSETAFSVASLMHMLGLYRTETSTVENQSSASNDDGTPADTNDALLEAICDVWHRNAMRISEVDFRIADTDEEQRRGGALLTPNSRANAYGGSAAYLVGSRLNHSCQPNALCVFSSVEDEEFRGSRSEVNGGNLPVVRYRGCLVVRALRRIQRGEEVTISYCPILSSADVKEQHCRFRCTCGLCSVQRNGHGELELPPPLHAVRCHACGSFVSSNKSGTSAQYGHRSSCPAAQTDRSLGEFFIAAEKAEAAANRRLHSILEECNQRRGVLVAGETNRSIYMRRVMKQLLQLESCLTQLAPTHWLRLRVQQEALAASVSASITAEDSLSLLDVSERLLAVVENRRTRALGASASLVDDRHADDLIGGLLPENWPLTTGLRMARVFALCRHAIGTATSATTEDDDSNTSLLYRGVEEIRALVELSLREHALQQFGLECRTAQGASLPAVSVAQHDDVSGPAAAADRRSSRVKNEKMERQIVCSFLERYRVELHAAGVLAAEDLLPLLRGLVN